MRGGRFNHKTMHHENSYTKSESFLVITMKFFLEPCVSNHLLSDQCSSLILNRNCQAAFSDRLKRPDHN